jgi:putative membrane protein
VEREDDRRWPRSVYGVGVEPDPRFSFANERVLLLVLGVVTSVGAFVRWSRNERALRDRRPLPGTGMALTLAYALAAVGIVLCVVVLWGALG